MRPLSRAALLTALIGSVALPAAAQQRNNDPASTPVQVAPASAPAPAPSTPPKLLVVISVDQFSADLFSEYRQHYTGGLARLARGVVFPQGYQAHAATETCPGHSTILTGSHPGRNGIIANNWYDLSLTREDRRVYCAEDPTVPGTSSGSGRYAPSPNYLMMPTLGDRMSAVNPATQVVSVAGKDRAAIMMGGRQTDEIWWLSPTGLSSYRGVEASPVVARISSAIAGAINRPQGGLQLPPTCIARDIGITLGDGRVVGNGRFAREAGNFRAFQASPEADGAVLAAAATLRAERHLGEGAGTDLLIVGLSATDFIGHDVGTEGAEMCLQMHALDRELGDFFARLDATGIDYAVMLTADHGGHDIPERNRAHAIPSAERSDPALSPDRLSATVAAQLGMGDRRVLYSDGAFGDFYVDRTLNAQDRQRVIDAAVRILRAHPQVETVLLGSELAAMPMPTRSPELWSVTERARAAYYPGRSGDFILLLKPRVTPIPEAQVGYAATHGSTWDYDRRVPILFWRRGIGGFEQPNPVMTVDILPTLAALINLPIVRGEIDGRCLDLDSGPGSSCPN